MSGLVWETSWVTASWWDHWEAPEGLKASSSGSWNITVAEWGPWVEVLDEFREWHVTSVVILGLGLSSWVEGSSFVSFDDSGFEGSGFGTGVFGSSSGG
jgi:hypothetical protein